MKICKIYTFCQNVFRIVTWLYQYTTYLLFCIVKLSTSIKNKWTWNNFATIYQIIAFNLYVLGIKEILVCFLFFMFLLPIEMSFSDFEYTHVLMLKGDTQFWFHTYCFLKKVNGGSIFRSVSSLSQHTAQTQRLLRWPAWRFNLSKWPRMEL